MKIKGMMAALFSFALLPSFIFALPYYVGENPTPQTRVLFGVRDAMTRLTPNSDSGNFADLYVRGHYRFRENMAAVIGLPVYVNAEPIDANEDFAAGVGNIHLGFNYSDAFINNPSFRLGYFAQAKAYLPSNRSDESLAYVRAYAPTSYYSFSPYTTTLTPGIGLMASQTRWSAKTNIAYGFHHISNADFAADDSVRSSALYQLGASFHPTARTNLSLEYNMIYLDDATSGDLTNWRHSIAPSFSGDFRQWVGSIYSVIPLDEDSRDLSALLFGAEIGYSF